MMHLRYCMMTAGVKCKETRHPQIVMRELGITYRHATPQSMGDQWWFWNCAIPGGLEMPGFLTELKVSPRDAIGHGLSEEMAGKIEDGED